ncbi:MAG: hypothetical protein WA865_04845 [Spirulinaceae cyanobacterium]
MNKTVIGAILIASALAIVVGSALGFLRPNNRFNRSANQVAPDENIESIEQANQSPEATEQQPNTTEDPAAVAQQPNTTDPAVNPEPVINPEPVAAPAPVVTPSPAVAPSPVVVEQQPVRALW